MTSPALQPAPCFDVRFTVEMQTRGNNVREHHFARATRVGKERDTIALEWFRLRISESSLFVTRKILRFPRGISKAARVLAKKTGMDLRQEHVVAHPLVPLVVELTRVSFGRLDSDGPQAALKGVRDEIAWQLGINDRDPIVKWNYDSPGQEHGPKGYAAVRVRIRARDVEVRR